MYFNHIKTKDKNQINDGLMVVNPISKQRRGIVSSLSFKRVRCEVSKKLVSRLGCAGCVC